MQAEVITIGSELLLGGRPETNSLFLVDQLAKLGIEVRWKTVVGDDERDIAEVLRRALQRSALVMTTGGLGCTVDDMTKKVVAKVTHRRLVLKEDLLQDLHDRFQKRRHLAVGLTGKAAERMPKSYERQALLPSQAQVLKNPVGTAPGFVLECGGHYLVVLPGVPHEMRRIFTDSVKGILQKLVRGPRPFVLQVIRTFGLTEAQVDDAIKELLEQTADQKLGLVAGPTGVDIYIMTRAGSAAKEGDSIEGLRETLRKRFGEAIYSEEGKDMEDVVGLVLRERGLQLAVAESCTGGLIGHRLTNIPGSSTYLERGVVCYSDLSKIEMLQVPAEIITRYGAVSSQVAIALAEGVRRMAKTDLGLGVTGIAGPGGGTPAKAVGLVHMALAYNGGTRQESFQFSGDRSGLKLSFSQAGLDLIRRHLLQP
jgi:nicotinamide-nucleotide amidase